MNIAENINAIQERIERAAAKSGRSAADIALVAASKTNSAERVREAFAAGINIFGENRVQEMLEKNSLGAYDGAHLHFIGHLQKNKVRQVVGTAELIHSADSIALLESINKTAANAGLIQDLLIEINIGGEESKSGFAPDALPAVFDTVSTLPAICVRGLMCIPPKCSFPEENWPYFALMSKLFVDNGAKKYDNVRMDFLSMGMSGDFEEAIACGANMVRVGSAIFGERVYPGK